MRKTSAEMTSPDFMSWFLRLSANRSAKLSPPVAAVDGMEDIKISPLAGMAVKNTPGSATPVEWKNPKLQLGYWFRELRSEEHTSELQSRENLVCRLLLEQ